MLIFIHTQVYCMPVALDCYLIGRHAFDKKDWEMAEGWMEEAVRKHLEGQ